MDPCLHLALLENSFLCDLAKEVRRLPRDERRLRYVELMAVEIPAGTTTARWTDDADLLAALPDGSDDVIHTLEGIETYPGLKNLHLRKSEVEDLRPLVGLPALTAAWLGVTARTDLTPLLSCDELRRVHIDAHIPSDTPAFRVLEALAERGVQVDNLLPDTTDSTTPFADPILKLAVLDDLGMRNALVLPTMHHFDEYAFDDDNLARLLAVQISQEQFDSIEVLSWGGGGHTVSHLVWHQWDGESDEFVIHSLTGIQALRNLKELAVSPLDALPADQVTALQARGVTVVEYW